MTSRSHFVLTRRGVLSLAGAGLSSVVLASCGGGSDTPQDAESASAEAQAVAEGDVTQLTVTPGKLTVATGDPAYEPWVANDDPASGEGFEAAVVYALADRMGFVADDVEWIRTSFDEAFAPGEHDWDLNIQQVSINDDRRQAVDFSPAYYRPTQAVVVQSTSDYARATSCADFADAVVGVQVGSTAYDYVRDILKGGSTEGLEVYDDNAAAAAAVNSGQADAIVTDTPTAVYMTGEFAEDEQISNGVVVGQIPGTEDEYGLGLTLAKDSLLTPYVEEAMNALVDDGTIEELTANWLADYTTNIPMLEE